MKIANDAKFENLGLDFSDTSWTLLPTEQTLISSLSLLLLLFPVQKADRNKWKNKSYFK